MCDGCNGGITENPEEYFGDYTAQAVRLRPFLLEEYSQEFVDNVCFIKMDTEECRDLDILYSVNTDNHTSISQSEESVPKPVARHVI